MCPAAKLNNQSDKCPDPLASEAIYLYISDLILSKS
jgi:hypothetical protein